MRTKNTIKNSIVTISFQMITLLVGIVVPRWILSVYGSEVNGLTANINPIINIINLLQAGIVGASIFEMYKPIVDEDYRTIGRIYYSSERYFKKFSYAFFGCTLLIIPYILMSKDNTLKPLDVVLAILILGLNATFIFRYYCKYDVIFSAYQKKYILIISMVFEKIIYYILLFMVLYFELHYVCMYIVMLVGSIIRIVYLQRRFNKLFKPYIAEFESDSDYKIKNQQKLFGNQIIQNVLESVPTIVVTTLYGLNYASVIYIYMMVANIFKMIVSTFQNAVSASFGDLIARGDKKKSIKVFSMFQYIYESLSIILYTCMNVMLVPFVKLYCDDATSISYVYSKLGIIVTMYVLAYTLFLPFNMFINSVGLYGKVLKFNVINGCMSIAITIICALINFEYVYLGVSVFFVLSFIHRYFILKKNGYELQLESVIRPVVCCVVVVISSVFNNNMLNIVHSWTDWIIYAIITFGVTLIMVLVYTLACARKEYVTCKEYALSIFRKK